MADKYRRLQYEGSGKAAGEFADAMKVLMSQFLEHELRSQTIEEDRRYRDEILKLDRIDKEKWRNKEMAWEEEKFQRNQWLTFNNNLYNTTMNMVKDHATLYETLLTTYEEAAGNALELDDLDITGEMARIMDIQTKDALAEAQNDAAAGGALLGQIQQRIGEIKNRMKLLDATGTYMVYNTRGPDSFRDEAIVKNDLIDAIWSAKDFEVMAADLKSDTDWLTKMEQSYGVKLFDENGEVKLPTWFDDYLNRLSSTPDDKIASLNVDLMKAKTQEIALESAHYEKDIKKVTWDAVANPENAWMNQLNTAINDLESIEKSYQFLPGFDHAYTNAIASAKKYGFDSMESSLVQNYQTNETVQAQVIKMMREDQFITDTQTPTVAQMGTYLQMKAEIDLASNDPVAMIVGTHTVKNVFSYGKQTHIRYAGMVEDALIATNTWVTGMGKNATEKDREAAWLLDYQWAQALGLNPKSLSDDPEAAYKTYKNQGAGIAQKYHAKVRQGLANFNTQVAPLIGSDGDLIDNPFMDIQKNVNTIQENIDAVIKTNVSSSNQIGNVTQTNNSATLDLTADIAACNANGGVWNGALNMCDLSGLSQNSVIGKTTADRDREELEKLRIMQQQGLQGNQNPQYPINTNLNAPDSSSVIDTSMINSSSLMNDGADLDELSLLVNEFIVADLEDKGSSTLDRERREAAYRETRPYNPTHVDKDDFSNIMGGKSTWREKEEVKEHGHSSVAYDQSGTSKYRH